MLKWFKNLLENKKQTDEVCRYCGRHRNNTALRRAGEYYSCIDSDSCLAHQNKDLIICKNNIANQVELEARKRAEQEEKKEREKSIMQQELYDRNNGLIDKFLQIAERKVSVIDAYGDENLEVLPSEILTCLKKIAQREKEDIDWKSYAKYSHCLPDNYKWLRDKLEKVFWEYHKEVQSKTSTESALHNMSGEEFETWVVKLLKENGFDDVRGTPKTGDQGADIIANKGDRIIIIQVKRYKGTVGNKAVQEVIGAMHYYSGNEGWVITNSLFTPSAIALAQKSKIKLIDGKALSRISEYIN